MDTHIWIPKAESSPLLAALKKQLTVSSKFDSDTDIQAFSETTDEIGIPRYFKSHYLEMEKIHDRTAPGYGIKFKVTSSYREGQKSLIDSLSFDVKNGRTGFIIQADTGSGKTFISIKAMEVIGKKTLIVVPKSDLLDQWVKEITTHTDIPRDKIGIGQLGDIEWEDKDVVVALVHTLVLDREKPMFKRQFGLVVFDEVHSSVPPLSFNSVASLFPAKYRIGISATPSRRDGLHVLNDWHIGETTLYMGKSKKMPSKIVSVPYVSSFAKEPPPHLDTMVRRSIILKQIEEDKNRTVFICKFILKAYRAEDRRTLVLADRTKILLDMARILEKNGVPKKDVGYYCKSLRFPGVDKKGKNKDIVKSVPKDEQLRAAKECKVILGTYGFASTGTNIPTLSVLILATPQSSVKQSVGRIERFLEGKKQPLVFDFLDVNYEMAVNWNNSREREYKQLGLDIHYYSQKG